MATRKAKVNVELPPGALPRRAPARDRTKRADVEGFGCPRTDWPHHVRVVIPDVRGGEVQVIEDFGVGGHVAGQQDETLRCALPRARWSVIADPVRREFNERLRALGLPVGAWRAGPGGNKVERMLGQELILLACACAAADEADLPAIVTSWAALRPEERWWFAGWLQSHNSNKVMRGAALLLSGGPHQAAARKSGTQTAAQVALPLFDARPAGKC